ncbi:MAG: citrate/2-methylcitrate synthase, partial [Myxococcota bacterium]
MAKLRKKVRKRTSGKAGKRPVRSSRSAKSTAGAKRVTAAKPPGAKGKDSLSITDNRTGRSYEIPVIKGVEGEAIRAQDLRQIRVNPGDFGLLSYDPAFTNTASCKSAVTWIDGDAGILEYRGYPIETLAKKSSFLEVAYLLIYGELPTVPQYREWHRNITIHTFFHENVKKFIDGFLYDAHPMGILVTTVAALSTFYPEAKNIFDPENRKLQVHRLIGKMPTLSAFAYRHSLGMPYVYPDNELSYTGNLLSMLYRIAEPRYSPDPILEKALDILFILHADHEQNCSANAMRAVGSSHVDPYSAIAAATSALYGPLHGGANEAVLRMLREIGSKDKISAYIKKVKAGKGRLMGFGHRVY